MSTRCEVCGGPIRTSNKIGVCQQHPECARIYRRRAARAARQTGGNRSEGDGYCEVLERFHAWCDEHGRSFKREMVAAIEQWMGGQA